jgi:hypothetical protein
MTDGSNYKSLLWILNSYIIGLYAAETVIRYLLKKA